MENAVIYEITALVRADLIAEFEDFMRRRHIPDLLATGCFRTAAFTRSPSGRYRIRYEAIDQTRLDNYLKTDAERLRADFLQHFPEGVALEREAWTVIQSWGNPV